MCSLRKLLVGSTLLLVLQETCIPSCYALPLDSVLLEEELVRSKKQASMESQEWTVSEWSECTVTCGSGLQTRSVRCLDEDGVISQDCDSNIRPQSYQFCGQVDCTTLASVPNGLPPTGEYTWISGDGTNTVLNFDNQGGDRYQVEQNTTESDQTFTSLDQTIDPPTIRSRTRVSGRNNVISFPQNGISSSLVVNGGSILTLNDDTQQLRFSSGQSISYDDGVISTHDGTVLASDVDRLHFYDGFRFYQFDSDKINNLTGPGTLYLNPTSGVALYSTSSSLNSQIDSVISQLNPDPEELPSPETTSTPTIASVSTETLITIAPTVETDATTTATTPEPTSVSTEIVFTVEPLTATVPVSTDEPEEPTSEDVTPDEPTSGDVTPDESSDETSAEEEDCTDESETSKSTTNDSSDEDETCEDSDTTHHSHSSGRRQRTRHTHTRHTHTRHTHTRHPHTRHTHVSHVSRSSSKTRTSVDRDTHTSRCRTKNCQSKPSESGSSQEDDSSTSTDSSSHSSHRHHSHSDHDRTSHNTKSGSSSNSSKSSITHRHEHDHSRHHHHGHHHRHHHHDHSHTSRTGTTGKESRSQEKTAATRPKKNHCRAKMVDKTEFDTSPEVTSRTSSRHSHKHHQHSHDRTNTKSTAKTTSSSSDHESRRTKSDSRHHRMDSVSTKNRPASSSRPLSGSTDKRTPSDHDQSRRFPRSVQDDENLCFGMSCYSISQAFSLLHSSGRITRQQRDPESFDLNLDSTSLNFELIVDPVVESVVLVHEGLQLVNLSNSEEVSLTDSQFYSFDDNSLIVSDQNERDVAQFDGIQELFIFNGTHVGKADGSVEQTRAPNGKLYVGNDQAFLSNSQQLNDLIEEQLSRVFPDTSRIMVEFETLSNGSELLSIDGTTVLTLDGAEITEVPEQNFLQYANNTVYVQDSPQGQLMSMFPGISRLFVLNGIQPGLVRYDEVVTNELPGEGSLYIHKPTGTGLYSRHLPINDAISQRINSIEPPTDSAPISIRFEEQPNSETPFVTLVTSDEPVIQLNPESIEDQSIQPEQMIIYRNGTILVLMGDIVINDFRDIDELSFFDGNELLKFKETSPDVIPGGGQVFVSENQGFYSVDTDLNDRIGEALLAVEPSTSVPISTTSTSTSTPPLQTTDSSSTSSTEEPREVTEVEETNPRSQEGSKEKEKSPKPDARSRKPGHRTRSNSHIGRSDNDSTVKTRVSKEERSHRRGKKPCAKTEPRSSRSKGSSRRSERSRSPEDNSSRQTQPNSDNTRDSSSLSVHSPRSNHSARSKTVKIKHSHREIPSKRGRKH